MNRRAALLKTRARPAAERGMTDTCVIRRRTGETTDPVTFVVTPTWVQVYAGKCRLQDTGSINGGARTETPGQDYQLLVELQLQIPMGAAVLEVEDEVTLTASENDPSRVGDVLLVRDLAGKTDASALRVGVTRRTS